MAILLVPEAPERVRDVQIHPNIQVTGFQQLRWGWSTEGAYVSVGRSHFPFFLIDNLLTWVTLCSDSSSAISSLLTFLSSLVLITPLLELRDLWGEAFLPTLGETSKFKCWQLQDFAKVCKPWQQQAYQPYPRFANL